MDKIASHEIFPNLRKHIALTVMEFKLSLDTDKIKTELDKYKSYLNSRNFLNGQAGTSFNENFDLLLAPQFKDLRNEFEKCLNVYAEEIGYKDIEITESWFNIMTQGSKVVTHIHNASIISGSYYPIYPEGSAGLTFFNPLKPYKLCEDPEYNAPEYTFPVCEGDLLLFPSWFEHGTKINTTTNERYVVAFNTNIMGLDEYNATNYPEKALQASGY